MFQFTGEVLPNDDVLLETVVALDKLGDALVMPETHLVFKLFPFIRFLPGSYGRLYRQLMENKRQLRELIFHETKVTFVVVVVVIILFVCLFLSSSFSFLFVCFCCFIFSCFALFCFMLWVFCLGLRVFFLAGNGYGAPMQRILIFIQLFHSCRNYHCKRQK